MGGKTLTRADLAEAVVRKVGLPRNESQELVELVLSEISGSLARGEQVKLSSFGSFGIREKGERMGRNPKTGEEVPITPRKVLVFRPMRSPFSRMPNDPNDYHEMKARNWSSWSSARSPAALLEASK